MSTSPSWLKRTPTDIGTPTPSPLRHGSTTSSNSSFSSHSFNSQAPSRTSTVSSNASSFSTSPRNPGHRRGNSELAAMKPTASATKSAADAGTTYESIRRSLRPLQQAPNVSPQGTKHVAFRHTRSYTVDETQYWKENRPTTPESRIPCHLEDTPPSQCRQDACSPHTPPTTQSPYRQSPHTISPRPHLPHARTEHSQSLSSVHPPPLTTAFSTPDLETFKKSSTGHLRTLSSFAKSSEREEFALDKVTPSVVGLQGRRRLKRGDSVAAADGKAATRATNASAWAAGNWMDKQRQFLQAYEYLCHIGEAKEWIEEVIHKSIPPIVQLEEALRDGVTLAEVVQAMYPDRKLRIFQSSKLQYRHSDNIALFFRFLDEVELPELFRFELIDLYEKKNIPKVIHCIHALSWLLFKKGIVDFRMGNLVGQLEFEHHELEQTQRGLDKAGVSMPSFAGMAANFGAEPEPEPQPVESEEDRIQRELHENEASIIDFQAQIRGAIGRLKLGNIMNDLWEFEPLLIELQSRLRGDWTRQIVLYRLSMRQFAINLQAISRGFIVRSRQGRDRKWRKAQESDVLMLQALIRASKVRADVKTLQGRVIREEPGIKHVQAAIRAALQRKLVRNRLDETRRAESHITRLQAAIRGALQRNEVSLRQKEMGSASEPVKVLQAFIRGLVVRDSLFQTRESLKQQGQTIALFQARARAAAVRAHRARLSDALIHAETSWVSIQSMIRAIGVRKNLSSLRGDLLKHTPIFTTLQSLLRANTARSFIESQRRSLEREEPSILETQSRMRGWLLRRKLDLDRIALGRQAHCIVELQALVRAAILRMEVGDILLQLEDCEDGIVQLQALARAMIVRVEVDQVLSGLEAEEDSIMDMQSRIRAMFMRRRFEEKRRHYQENMEKVIKVQSFVRGRIQGQAYKSLTSGKNPPVGTVKGFVHLLNDSDFDFDEEIEFERLRKVVVQQVRQNELAEQYISQLDIKIALLVKNKITLDEVVKHQKHFGGHIGSLMPNTDMSSKDPFDLKALNKTSRRKLEQYQVLFFLLQTQSQYLARLFRRLRELNTPEKEYDRIRHLMMGLFGYSQKRREEYYLIKLLARSAREEIDSTGTLQEYLRCNSFWTKLFSAYVKSPRDRKFLRDVMGTLVKESVINNPELDLESDPLQIYRSAISNEELRTGQRSKRQPDLPREEAIRDPETRATFIQNLQDLRDIADQFFSSLEEVLQRMPFGLRHIAQQMYEHLVSRFPNEEPGVILQIVGHWVWKNYFQPAMTEPEKHGVVDRGLTQEQKRNLGEVAKCIGQVAAGRLFGADNVYLQPLNTYVGDSIPRLGHIWGEMIAVQDAESYFDIDEFNDLYAKTKPTLYIKMSDIFSIHQLIASEISYICPTHDDILKEVIRDLGNVKNNENELMTVNSAEINLTLNPKLTQAEDPEAEVKALFMETKRCILYIIRVQAGANLLDIMVKAPSEDDEKKWHALVRDELTTSNARRGAYSEANTLVDIGSLSYTELKQTALENILQLEQAGKISRHNHYQDLLNAIAIDIRTKHRRRIQRARELEGSRLTLARLNDQSNYLEQQLKTYNDYIEQAMITLQNKKGKKRFLLPFTKQWDHQRELQKSGKVFKFGSYKYSARNLADRGVLVSWKGYSDRQWDRVDLTISSNEVGVFTIDGSSGNMMIPGANAQVPLDDLLQAQFNNTQFLDFFDGQLRVNVNLFLHLIMKKFYND